MLHLLDTPLKQLSTLSVCNKTPLTVNKDGRFGKNILNSCDGVELHLIELCRFPWKVEFVPGNKVDFF